MKKSKEPSYNDLKLELKKRKKKIMIKMKEIIREKKRMMK